VSDTKRSASDKLHAEADAASAPRPHISEVINPRQTMARREAEAGMTQTDTSLPASTPAPVSTGGMSQADFGGTPRPRTGPPADMLKRHRGK